MRSDGQGRHDRLLDHLHRDLIACSGGELDDEIAALVARRRVSSWSVPE
ncbi:hypothetical protein ACFYZJ_12305 [Streptomyces sp. NPDC001848]